MSQLTVESLIDAIRSASDLAELKRLVGPSDDEKATAEQRLRNLDALSPFCEWDNMCPSLKADDARKRYNRILSEQMVYEGAYL
ncbi:hypothetical protein ACQVRV_00030 (plasmid) [Ralstonia pseudosolanacearum]